MPFQMLNMQLLQLLKFEQGLMLEIQRIELLLQLFRMLNIQFHQKQSYRLLQVCLRLLFQR